MISKPTLAIYGIKDRNQLPRPGYIHDHNLCLMHNGKILQYLSLERYTRRKYDNRLDEFLEELIESKILQLPDDFDLVSVNSFVGNCFISQKGRIRFETSPTNFLSTNLENARAYYQYKDWEGREINAFNCAQELAHIASCMPFFGSFKDNSLLIHFDGAASLSNFSAFFFKDGKIKLIEYGWDMKNLANFFNDNALTFKIIGAKPGDHCSVPGKLMGYACLGSYNPLIELWLKSNSFFKESWSNSDLIFQSIKKHFGYSFNEFDNTEPFFQDIAATFQHIFERELLKKIQCIQQKVKADFLYYSGGCALNIVANTKLLEQNLFKNIFIPPCCNDSGLSLGAAAMLEWKKGNEIEIHDPYLNNLQLPLNQIEPTEELIENVAEILLMNGIVGVCNGFGEAGPRALGNRSLIALPNSMELAKRLSMEVKKREWYRPVAPIMLTEVAETVVGKPIHHLSKFMLLDFEVKSEFCDSLQGVIHANNTARIQTLNSYLENPFLFKLLGFLHNNHNILGLINTSFNVQGEPIVHSQASALKSAHEMNLDAIILNNKLIKL